MNFFRVWRRLLAYLTVPTLGLLLAVVFNQWLSREGLPHRAQKLAKETANLSGNANTTVEASDTTLTDSILSIVQSYYVDQDRVDNRSLLLTAIASLSNSPRVKTGANELGVWIEVDDQRRSFALTEEPHFSELLAVFTEVAQMLENAKVSIVTPEAAREGESSAMLLLNAMLAELDPHSTLLSPEAYRELRQGTEGAFGGLGVLVGIRDNLLTVIKPLPKSPALRAGIRKFDRILGIDGTQTFGYTLDELVEHMRGDPGTDVHLSLLRDGAISPSEITLKREVIRVDSVQTEDHVRDGANILRLTIENFASRTSREVLSAIKKARGRFKGALAGIVLDLRANPGGLLDQAVQVSDLFLEQGIIVTTRGRREEVESAGSGFDEVRFPLVILVDGDSASASEIVAGALQDHGRALVIGQPTFGKGSVQTIFELPSERALKLTIARYYTPAGRSIQNVGIIPDVWLQPVFKSKDHVNLFGGYRYKNERFLRNHLDDGREKGVREQPIRWPASKAYYISGRDVEDDGLNEDKRQDQELDLALDIIALQYKTYGEKMPAEAQRASHWLGLAGPTLQKKAEEMNRQTWDYLKKEENVEWVAAKDSVYGADLVLELSDKEITEVVPGAQVKALWKIKNRETKPVHRLSIFVRSEIPGFETREYLVGTVAANGERNGSLEIPIPQSFEPGPVLLRVGVAVDAWPAHNAALDLPIVVAERKTADIDMAAQLTEEVGGSLAGVLEGAETAVLKVQLKNQGEAEARDVEVKLVNLSGEQVKVLEGTTQIKAIKKGGSTAVDFKVKAQSNLLSNELAFGITVDSKDLKSSQKHRFTIKSRGNSEFSGIPGVTSH